MALRFQSLVSSLELAALLLQMVLSWSGNGGLPRFFLPGVSAFQQQFHVNSGREQRYHHHHRLYMVSQKEKRRLQQSNERTQKLQQVEIVKAQKALVLEFQEILSQHAKQPNDSKNNNKTKKKKNSRKKTLNTRQVNKLLKNAQHDGLIDVGMEARLLGLEIFYRANKPSDMVSSLLLSVPSEDGSTSNAIKDDDQVIMDQFGLWAYSKLEDWNSALPYANRLYIDKSDSNEDDDHTSEAGVFATQANQDSLRDFAIQAFANTDQNLARTNELVLDCLALSSSSSPPTSDSLSLLINSLLQSFLRTGKLHDAKRLFREALDVNNKSTANSTTTAVLDVESFRLALECAAALGDISLMDEALGDTEQVLMALSTAAIVEDIELFAHEMNADAETATSVLKLILRTLSNNDADDVLLSPTHQTLARNAIQVLVANQELDDEPELLSQILVALQDREDVKHVVLVCNQNYHGQNKKKNRAKPKQKGSSWHESLTDAAKVHILPALVSLELEILAMASGVLTTDSWKVLMSLVTTTKDNSALSNKSLAFLSNEKSHDFCVSALTVAASCARQEGNREGYLLGDAIVARCCETVLSGCTLGDANYYANVMTTLRWFLPDTNDAGIRCKLFATVAGHFEQQICEFLSTADKENSHDPKKEGIPSFENEHLNMIVPATVMFLKSIPKEATMQVDESFKRLVVSHAELAMQLVDSLPEFSVRYSYDHAASDNGAKEALQTIMQELVLSKVVSNIRDLFEPAIRYYFCLGHVARTSSVIDYEDLFFSISIRRAWATRDPYQEFVNCVLGVETKADKGEFLLESVLAMLDLDDDKDEDKEIAPLLQTIAEMAIVEDKKMYDYFVREYKKYFLDWRYDLFFDKKLYGGLCEFLSAGALAMQGFKDARNIASGIVQAELIWFEDFLSSGLAQDVIQRLVTCEDARRYVSYSWGRKDFFVFVEDSTKFLVGIYAQAGAYYKMEDEKSTEKLGDSYLNACRENCRHLAEQCLSKAAANMLPADLRVKGSNWDKKQRHFTGTVSVYLKYLSRHIFRWGSEEFEAFPSFPKLPDDTSAYALVTVHILDSFLEVVPNGIVRPNTSDDIKLLHPEVVTVLRAWCDKNMPKDEEA